MATYASGVNFRVLRWARERAGYSREEVARHFKKDVAEIEGWETGTSVPTYSQLEILAYTLYKRPVAIFFFPEPPDEPEPSQSFRTLPESEIKKLQPDTRLAIRQAQAMQILRWLRVPGDTIFAVGALVLVAFVFRVRVSKPTTSR